ncbi:hypothetical protein P0E69_00800 [Chimaeribacter arupi]|uniref:hypothetical protein n=1 Tax=Chimaeribacter arupi TaxID=2060066 RepID=UPI0027121074|nr:hypothetical protein [Chimaeribacter arupi]WKZ92539.1 hypothetical protein P0E69_00800 [Chimaeribacter arupi]
MLMTFAVMSWICSLITGGCIVNWKNKQNSDSRIAMIVAIAVTVIICGIYLVVLIKY